MVTGSGSTQQAVQHVPIWWIWEGVLREPQRVMCGKCHALCTLKTCFADFENGYEQCNVLQNYIFCPYPALSTF